jgi:peroxiredoxin
MRRALVTLVLCSLVAACSRSSAPSDAPPPPAPDWELPTLDGSGQIRLSELRGRVVVLSFWASWCRPCRRELPALQRLLDANQDQDLEVVGVNVDEDLNAARTMAKRLKLGITMVHDHNGEQTQSAYPIEMIPTTFLVDRSGRLRSRHVGYNPRTTLRLKTEVRALLADDADGDPR